MPILPIRPRRRRARAAAERLDAARTGFDRSLTGLRGAALDHVDRHHRAVLALRAVLDRFAAATPG